MLTDLQPHQKCVAIVTRLGESAREMFRMIAPQKILHGGIRKCHQLGFVSYMIDALQDRFAASGE
jgi:hypothetical protein